MSASVMSPRGRIRRFIASAAALVVVTETAAVLTWAVPALGAVGEAWVPLAALAAIGVVLRVALPAFSEAVFSPAIAGAAALILAPKFAVVVAAIIGLAGLVRARRRALLALCALVGSVAAAAATRMELAAWLDVPPQLDSAPAFAIVPVLAAGMVLFITWQGYGLLTDRLAGDLDLPAGVARVPWPTVRGGRWLPDFSLAIGAVVAAAVWQVHPALAVLALVPMVASQRLFEHPLHRVTLSTDRLTGLPNTAGVRTSLWEEASRALRFNRTVAVAVIDVDHMDELTSRHGGPAADTVLRAAATRFRQVVRDYDVVGRTGADRFTVILPETDAAGARTVVERLLQIVAGEPFELPGVAEPARVTASVGLAMLPADSDDPEDLLVEAELAAAYARVQGGNRLMLASRLPEEFRGAAPTRVDRSEQRAGHVAAPAETAPVPVRAPAVASVPRPRPRVPENERLVRVAAEPLAHARPNTDRLLAAVIVAATIATATATALEADLRNWVAVLLFGGLAAGAEWFAESIYGRSSSSWAAVPLVALAIVAPSANAIVLATVLAAGVGGVLRGVRSRQALFNVAVLILAGLAAHQVVTLLNYIPLQATSVVPAVVIGVIAGAAFFVVNTWLVATAVAVTASAPVLDVWRQDLLWLVPHQLGMGALAGAMAIAYEMIGLSGVMLLTLPAVGLHLAQRQFVTRTRDHVVRLRQLNDELSHANTHIVRVNERLTEALGQVNEGYLVTVESLAAAVDAKDSYTGSHIDRVEAYGRLLVEVVDPGLVEDEEMLWGFRLHDVGKIGVPDRILLKPGPLDDDEWELMRRHPEIGAGIIAAAPFLKGARDIVLHHHERWDGRGYPRGLAQNAIPFGARLFSLVDAYDAMTSNRPYRAAMPVEQALEELLRHASTQFDPEMVEAMLQIPLDRLIAVPDEVERLRAKSVRRSRIGGLLIPVSEPFDGLLGDRLVAS